MPQVNLTDIDILKNLNSQELKALENFLLLEKYQEGDFVFKKGTTRDKIIIIKNGLVSMETELDKREIIALFKSGDALGEMALIQENSRHQHDLKVVSEELDTWELSSYNWYSLIKQQPSLANKIYKNIAANLSDRLHHSNNKLAALFATGRMIATYNNISSLAEAILKITLQIIPSDRALFLSHISGTDKVQIQKNIAFANIKENTYIDIKKDKVLHLLFKNPSTTIFNQDNWPKGSSDLVYKCRSLIIAPVYIRNKVFAFIILGDKSNKKDFSLNNQILLQAIASQAAPAMEDLLSQEMSSAKKELTEIYIDPFSKY